MTEEEARGLMEHLNAALSHLDKAVVLAEALSVESEGRSLRETIIRSTGWLVGDAVLPIVSLYPALDPFSKPSQE